MSSAQGPTGWLEYRLGKPGAIELTYPSSRDKTQQALKCTRYTRPQFIELGGRRDGAVGRRVGGPGSRRLRITF